MRRAFTVTFLLLLTITPWRIRAVVYRRVFKWEISPTARIGLSLFLHVRHVKLGAEARIGHLNVFRDLRSIEIQDYAGIGSLNWFTASPTLVADSTATETACLVLGQHSAITSRHYIDCPGGVLIGDFTTIAGVRSTILTHQIDVTRNRQTISPVRIGSYCMVGSNTCLLPSSSICDRVVVGLGSVVHGQLDRANFLYAGVPARPVRPIEGAYFHRDTGRVD